MKTFEEMYEYDCEHNRNLYRMDTLQNELNKSMPNIGDSILVDIDISDVQMEMKVKQIKRATSKKVQGYDSFELFFEGKDEDKHYLINNLGKRKKEIIYKYFKI